MPQLQVAGNACEEPMTVRLQLIVLVWYVILVDTRDDHLGLAWVWALGRAEECLHSPYNRIHALLCRNLEAL